MPCKKRRALPANGFSSAARRQAADARVPHRASPPRSCCLVQAYGSGDDDSLIDQLRPLVALDHLSQDRTSLENGSISSAKKGSSTSSTVIALQQTRSALRRSSCTSPTARPFAAGQRRRVGTSTATIAIARQSHLAAATAGGERPRQSLRALSYAPEAMIALGLGPAPCPPKPPRRLSLSGDQNRSTAGSAAQRSDGSFAA